MDPLIFYIGIIQTNILYTYIIHSKGWLSLLSLLIALISCSDQAAVTATTPPVHPATPAPTTTRGQLAGLVVGDMEPI